MKSKIIEMFRMQSQLNWDTAGVNWMIRADVVFENAIIAETAELLESLGYKWWKEQTIDMDNAKVEVVDLWHFVMSFVMQQPPRQISIEELADAFTKSFVIAYTPDNEHMLRAICYRFVGEVCNYNGDYFTLATAFSTVVRGVGLTFDELYTMYIVKNALNKLRQDRGYTDGTYRKDWNGVEDNVVAMQIGKGLTFGDCYAKLAEYYDTHITS